MSIDSISNIKWPQNNEIQSSFSLVLEFSSGNIGYFPYLCFDYIDRHDSEIYKILISHLELSIFNSYLDGFRFLGYKSALNERILSLERLFQRTSGRDIWNKWIHDRTFTILGEEYYISGDTVNDSNFSIFSSIIYIYSNNKYLAKLDESNGIKTCQLYMLNVDNLDDYTKGHVIEYYGKNNLPNTDNSISSRINRENAKSCASIDKIDVFISYSRKDSQFVSTFLPLFREHGINAWIDIDGIYTGEAFKKVITKAIKSSKVFLFFSSAASNSSEWTAKEINLAVLFKKKIIPIKINQEEYNDEVVFDLAGLHFIDYSNSCDRKLLDEKLIKSIKNLI